MRTSTSPVPGKKEGRSCRMLWSLIKAGAVAAATTILSASAYAQDVDPALKDSWAFMQQAMPGVPYQLLADSCKEGTVMLYHGTWVDAQQAQIAGFNKRFPCIKVQTYSDSISVMRQRYMSEEAAGRHVADIVQDSDVSSLNDDYKNGLLMNYTISNDDKFTDQNKRSGVWYPIRVALVGIAWNTDNVSDDEASILQDWQGAADSRWANRAAMSDPGSKGVAYQHLWAWYKLYGDDFLKKIGALHPRIIAGANNSMSALASGDVDVVLNASETGLLPMFDKGAPIKWSLPSPGVGPLSAQAISKDAPHPNAAKLYQEYTFTQEGYGLWTRLGGAPATKAYPDTREVAKETWYKLPDSFFDIDPVQSSADFDKLIADFNKYVGTSR
jgi:ABC-type Fe3+ transport system substrate-binding protein